MDRVPPLGLAAVTVMACLTLTACAGGGTSVDAGGVSVLVGAKADNAASALLSGTLTNVSGCLGVDDTVVVWPHGTTVVREDPLTVRIPHVGRVTVGGQVSVGGGVAIDQEPVPHDVGTQELAGVTVPAACTRHTVWVGG